MVSFDKKDAKHFGLDHEFAPRVPRRTDDNASTINFWLTPHRFAVKFWHFLWHKKSQSSGRKEQCYLHIINNFCIDPEGNWEENKV